MLGGIAGVAIGVIFAPALGGIILTLAAAGAVGFVADRAITGAAGWVYDELL